MPEVTFPESGLTPSTPGADLNWEALNRFRNGWIYPDGSRHYLPSDFASLKWFDVTDTQFAGGAVADGPVPTWSIASPATSFATTVAAGSNGVHTNTFLGAGVLSLASTGGGCAGRGVIKITQGSTVAKISYTGISGSTLTGCKLINGVDIVLATGNVAATAPTDNTAAFVAAAAACARNGGVLYIPAGRYGSYVVSGKIPVYANTVVMGDGFSSCIYLADNSLIGGRDTTSTDVGIIELADPAAHHVVVGTSSRLRIHGNNLRQIGHSSGQAWTISTSGGTTLTSSSLTFTWQTTPAAGLPPAPFPIIVGGTERMIVASYDIPTKTATVMTGTRGWDGTPAAVHGNSSSLEVSYSNVVLDMTNDPSSQQLEQHYVQYLFSERASGHGVSLQANDAFLNGQGQTNNGNSHMHDAHIEHCDDRNSDGYSYFHWGADGHCVSNVSAGAGLSGFRIAGGNCRGHDNKAYNAGARVDALGYALYLSGTRCTDLGVEGQDNNSHGLFITGNSNTVDFFSDANGRVIDPSVAVAFSGVGANNNEVRLKSVDRHTVASGACVQDYALGFYGGAVDNKVFFSNKTVRLGDIDPAGDPTGNYIYGDGRGGQQKPGLGAISAGAYTTTLLPHPDRGERYVLPTLAANLTIGKPTNRSLEPTIDLGDGVGFGPCYADQEIYFVIQQDATGGRTVTLNAVFKVIDATWLKTTANARSVFHAVCLDPSTWVQIP